MGWNYRVMRHRCTEEDEWLAIHEVFYRNDDADDNRVSASQTGYTEKPIEVRGLSIGELRWQLTEMLRALDKPVLEFREVDEPK